jgi:RHS repeat-associated protein
VAHPAHHLTGLASAATYAATDNAGAHPSASGTSTWGINLDNQLTGLSGGASYSYDVNGNLTQDGASCSTTGIHCYTYDAEGEGRVLTATATAGGTWSYRYDPFGRRIAKIAPSGTTTLYLPDQAGNEVGEYDLTTGNALNENAFDPAMAAPVAWLSFTGGASPVINFNHVDRLGSVVVTSSGSAIVNQYKYMGWGESATLSSGFGYAGYRYDAETGLYYVRARYYDPRLGRFLEPDPLGQQPGLNIYAYTGGDPLNLTDPLGLCAGIGCGIANAAYSLIQTINPIGTANAQVVLAPPATPPIVGGSGSVSSADELSIAQSLSAVGNFVASAYNAVASAGAWDYRSRALLAAGIDPASADAQNYDVHHIVAVTALAAQPARNDLASAGIGIHDLQNLVVLPTDVHQGLHTNAYYQGVNTATFVGLNAGGAVGVSAALATIKASLSATGALP